MKFVSSKDLGFIDFSLLEDIALLQLPFWFFKTKKYPKKAEEALDKKQNKKVKPKKASTSRQSLVLG